MVFADVVLQHIIDRDTAFEEMMRVLKPSGTLILYAVNTPNPFHSFYKKMLALAGREYEYGYERTYTPRELMTFFEEHGLTRVEEDGFFIAYGMYRWGYTYPIFKITARIINRSVRLVESLTGRVFSSRYGFIIVCVGKKL